MGYKIIFIDEEKGQHEWFAEYFDRHNKGGIETITYLFPGTSIEEMIGTMDEHHPDAIIADFLLNDMREDINYNVPYTGVDIVQAYQHRRPQFPCFILTSKDDDALNESSDVNMIYLKGTLNKEMENAKVSFYDRVIRQIQAYRNSIDSAQLEIEQLIEKRRSGRTSRQEDQRLIELDNFIEKSLDRESAIPDEMKKPDNIDKLSSMVAKLDELLAKLD